MLHSTTRLPEQFWEGNNKQEESGGEFDFSLIMYLFTIKLLTRDTQQ